MKQFEYLFDEGISNKKRLPNNKNKSYEAFFNDLGKEGWEFIPIQGTYWNLMGKREITPEPEITQEQASERKQSYSGMER